jgi:hypothetical protein
LSGTWTQFENQMYNPSCLQEFYNNSFGLDKYSGACTAGT